ncbi:MAG: hypothetical protein GX780_06355 [Campylobacteraceae bacterium]|nr:hypothetical protein [Campylobacteraceae bacterium]
MVIREIQQFAEVRYRARAYLCYLFGQNLPSRLPEPSLKAITTGLDKITNEINSFEALYLLDYKGEQVIDNITTHENGQGGMGENLSHKAYYYRAVREGRCVLTDPYPSSITNNLTVTAAMPIYDDMHELKYVACIDISLADVLKIAHPSPLYSIFGHASKIVYSAFSLALFLVALFLFIQGIESFFKSGFTLSKMNVEEMFESTIILTLALAIFDLVKTIFEEEVLGRNHKEDSSGIHKTMVRFLGSIIIALAIESLMLVFKFAITGPENILYAVYLLGGVTMLLIGLSIYLRAVKLKGNENDRYL